MTNPIELIDLLSETEDLLFLVNEKGWANVIRGLKERADVDLDEAKLQLRQLFGGMGSFNDLVLQANGQLFDTENDRLNELRNKLFEFSL
jgi:hypothetical protein